MLHWKSAAVTIKSLINDMNCRVKRSTRYKSYNCFLRFLRLNTYVGLPYFPGYKSNFWLLKFLFKYQGRLICRVDFQGKLKNYFSNEDREDSEWKQLPNQLTMHKMLTGRHSGDVATIFIIRYCLTSCILWYQ